MSGVLSVPKAVRGAFLEAGPRRATLAHFLALSAWAPLAAERDAPAGQVARAARILDLAPEEALAWRPEGRGPSAALPPALREEVAERIAEAFSTALPLSDGGAPSGLGWWVELLHLAVTELRIPLREALSTPVSQIFCLAAAHAAAHGGRFSAPAYEEADLLDELPGTALPVVPGELVDGSEGDGANPRADGGSGIVQVALGDGEESEEKRDCRGGDGQEAGHDGEDTGVPETVQGKEEAVE